MLADEQDRTPFTTLCCNWRLQELTFSDELAPQSTPIWRSLTHGERSIHSRLPTGRFKADKAFFDEMWGENSGDL